MLPFIISFKFWDFGFVFNLDSIIKFCDFDFSKLSFNLSDGSLFVWSDNSSQFEFKKIKLNKKNKRFKNLISK